MNIRKKDIARARSARYLSTYLGKMRAADDVAAYFLRRFRAMGYRMAYKKGPKGWKAARMTTTMRRTVYLGTNWAKKGADERAALLAHEYVHARQHRGYKGFLARYVFDSRFRWAVEAQAYRESVRAYRAMGRTEPALREYAENLPGRFIKNYVIGGRRMRKGVRRHMPGIVMLP